VAGIVWLDKAEPGALSAAVKEKYFLRFPSVLLPSFFDSGAAGTGCSYIPIGER
jgi:hypothetical protein